MAISGYTTTTYKPQAQTTELDKIIAQMQEQAGIAGAATAGRQATVESIFDEIISRYGPEGTYGKGAEAMLERQKVKDVGAGAQRMISSGLYGTEAGAGLGRAWESEVGAPARLRLDDIKMERLSQAQLGKAGFMERIEDVYPDYGMISQLISQAAAGPTGQYPGGYQTREAWGDSRQGIQSEIYGMGVQPGAGATSTAGLTAAEQRGYSTAGGRPAIEMGEPIYGAAAQREAGAGEDWESMLSATVAGLTPAEKAEARRLRESAVTPGPLESYYRSVAQQKLTRQQRSKAGIPTTAGAATYGQTPARKSLFGIADPSDVTF